MKLGLKFLNSIVPFRKIEEPIYQIYPDEVRRVVVYWGANVVFSIILMVFCKSVSSIIRQRGLSEGSSSFFSVFLINCFVIEQPNRHQFILLSDSKRQKTSFQQGLCEVLMKRMTKDRLLERTGKSAATSVLSGC